jgi:hypothetical protein
MVGGFLVVNLTDSHLKNCWTTKYLYFGGKVFFEHPLEARNCVYDLGLKWYILITNYIGCFSRRPQMGLREKLKSFFWILQKHKKSRTC